MTDFCSFGTFWANAFQMRMRPDTSPAAMHSSVGSIATHCSKITCQHQRSYTNMALNELTTKLGINICLLHVMDKMLNSSCDGAWRNSVTPRYNAQTVTIHQGLSHDLHTLRSEWSCTLPMIVQQAAGKIMMWTALHHCKYCCKQSGYLQ